MRKRILIADDIKINRRMLRVIFGEDYEYMEADNGVRTVEMLDEYGTAIDLVLLDLNMPEKDGFGVLEHLKQTGLLDQIPVIVVTSSTQPDDEINAFRIGADEIVRKPYIPEVILRRAHNLMELYASRRDLQNKLVETKNELSGVRKFDRITGILNMDAFLEEADKKIHSLPNEEAGGYIVFFSNVRNFKYFNMKYGMEQGDAVLKKLGTWIYEGSPQCIHGRFGQDHFVSIGHYDNPRETVKQICDAFDAEFGVYGMQMKVGMYRLHSAQESASQACEYAKLAVDAIRNVPEFFCEHDDALNRKIEVRAYVLQHIDEAIEKKHIKVYYQPVVRTESGKTCGFEALARWHDDNIGFLSPADFIPALEENLLITKVDLHVLRTVCEDFARMKRDGRAIVPVSINLSRVDFQQCDIFTEVEKIVAETKTPRELINIEITETAITEDPVKLGNEIIRFREGGYQVWMDDFGSGYSSLNVLKDYRFDEIKLDMKFLSNFDERSRSIVSSVIDMVKRIGIQTLAEGVETREQYDFLKYNDCDKVQGYYISRPAPLDEILQMPVGDPKNIETSAKKH